MGWGWPGACSSPPPPLYVSRRAGGPRAKVCVCARARSFVHKSGLGAPARSPRPLANNTPVCGEAEGGGGSCKTNTLGGGEAWQYGGHGGGDRGGKGHRSLARRGRPAHIQRLEAP